MGVFSELDLENQQAELEGHGSKAAEVQTLQAKLIQQHEQKKAAAASEAPSKEPAAKPVAKTEAEQEDPAAAETERRRQHEEAEAKRKAEWERQQEEKRAAETAALAKIEQMSETELVKASMERMKKETERLTRRNLKECVSEYGKADIGFTLGAVLQFRALRDQPDETCFGHNTPFCHRHEYLYKKCRQRHLPPAGKYHATSTQIQT